MNTTATVIRQHFYADRSAYDSLRAARIYRECALSAVHHRAPLAFRRELRSLMRAYAQDAVRCARANCTKLAASRRAALGTAA